MGAQTSLKCANCGQKLDLTDKFCRECGLPTIRRAEMTEKLPVSPPDTQELKRSLDVKAEPKPFVRQEPEPEPDSEQAETTGSVVQATSPTFAAGMATSTAIMVGVIVLFAVGGV